MTESLDYLQGLGITAVWMTPIFPSPAYHGYQHMPADHVNPCFGTDQDFIAFVKAAHARKIKVFVDLVVYGISRNSEYYASAHNNPASPYASMQRRGSSSGKREKCAAPSILSLAKSHTLLTGGTERKA